MGQLTAQQIYDYFHTHATGTDSLSAAQIAAVELSSLYDDQSYGTQQLIDSLGAGWKGQASEAASQGLAPLAENSYQTGQGLDSAQTAAGSQIDMFHATASKVTSMPAKPALDNPLPLIAIGAMPPTAMDQVNTYNSAAQQNVDAYSAYSTHTTSAVHAMPDLSAQMDAQSAPIAVAPVASSNTATSAKGTAYRHATTSPIVTSRSVSSGSTASPPAGHAGQSAPTATSTAAVPPPQPTGSTTTQGWTPPATTAPGTGPGTGLPTGGLPRGTGAPNIGGNTTSGGPNYVTGGFLTGVPDEPGPVGGVSGDIASRLGSGGRVGSAAGLTGEGEGGTGLRVGAGGSVEEGPGTRAGVGATAAAMEEEALANPRGVSSTGALGGPLAGGRSKRGEESEHETKFVQAEEHDEIFGVDRVIQPVLGETPEQARARHEQS
jgi:hypothetical protein